MAGRPRLALHLLSRTAANHRVNLAEQVPRLLAGAAMFIRSTFSEAPLLFEAGGAFIVLTSAALLVIPLRWHSGYAIWWSERLRPRTVRALAPLSVVGGAALIYATL
jgi:hypothetical protein